ncbi:MAG TPA: M48 family metallopeptidase [Candidatus Omnitrophota bacterium]|nr:MAG: hypothetical protein BWY49_00216 [Candidatus Omnitrophica bacterium ADurb.Bin314]HOE69170.1 M48 family metallopeptidase [Candidatus Omnitrophota bacterium]HQB93900.1 M48 family metallopeptidase [Candidatus Omnitrophota bacterium]
MNFFARQEKARKRTFLLLFFYALAVIGTILSVYGVARFSWYLVRLYSQSRTYAEMQVPVPFDLWDPRFFLVVTGVVCVVVLFGTWFKIAELSSGGVAVAKMLGGEQILPNTTDPDERKVLNVVEEMSIASGVPVPAVFLLKKEYGINAFAAGFSTQDMVIGVTSGAVKLLTRDELQGVIAHEFSHIFNGDMRLNMNLMGFLHGLLLIALTGRVLLEGLGRGRVRSSGKGGAAILVIVVFGLMLIVVGYIGVFFCNLIKSAVSRQREFLADASSAQYTRNPSGLAGALKKIAGLPDGSFIGQTRAQEVSHFFFADGATLMGEALFPTHPPIGLRIKLLDPSFDGKYPAIRSIAPKVPETKRPGAARPLTDRKIDEWERKVALFQTPLAVAAVSGVPAPVADNVVASVGNPAGANPGKARCLLEEMPKHLREAALTLDDAMALVYGLLIDRMNSSTRTRQLEYLSREADPAVHRKVLRLLPDFSSLKIEFCLPLIDLATPALKTQTRASYEKFRANIEALIHTDQTVTVFEFALERVVLHHLDFFFRKTKRPVPIHASLAPLLPQCAVLLSYLAGAGSVSKTLAQNAFMKAARSLAPGAAGWTMIPAGQLSHGRTAKALEDMAAAFPKIKEQFLRACVVCVEHDGRLDIREMELLRAFASVLDCPIPPLASAGTHA